MGLIDRSAALAFPSGDPLWYCLVVNKEGLMPDRKMIAVVGATGAQGGGLVRAIINEPAGGFAVRALTRDTQSAKAKQLTLRMKQRLMVCM